MQRKVRRDQAQWTKTVDRQENDGARLVEQRAERQEHDLKKDISYLYREINFFLREGQPDEALIRAKKIIELDPTETKAQHFIDVVIPELKKKKAGEADTSAAPLDRDPTITPPLSSETPDPIIRQPGA